MKRTIYNVISWLGGSIAALSLATAEAQPVAEGTQSTPEQVVRFWRTSEGLSANIILNLAQTPDGYLWLGTTHGLVRFDGIRFESFLTTRSDQRFGTRIEGLEVDATGRLWIVAEQRGLFLWQDRRLTEFHTNATELPEPTSSICSDSDNWIWVADRRGNLARFSAANPTKLEAVDFKLPPGAKLLRDGKGNLWAGATRSVCGLIGGTWKQVWRPRSEIQALGGRRDGGLWLVMEGNLYQLAEDGTLSKPESLPWTPRETQVTSLFEDARGILWIGTSSRGVHQRRGGNVQQVVTTPRSVKSIYQDGEGNVWIGTRGDGLACLRQRVFHMLNARAGLRNEYVNSIAQDSIGRLWLATEEAGLGWIEQGRWRPLTARDGWKDFNVMCLAPDRCEGMWIATGGQGLWRWQSNQFTRLRPTPDLPAASPRCLLQGQDGKIWVVMGDVALVSIQDGVSERHGARNGLNTQRVRTLAEDAAGGIWAGDWHGGIWHYGAGRWREVRAPSSISEAVRAMAFDTRGNLWIGTASAGLFRLQGDQFSQISQQHGLPANEIEQVLIEEGNLWFGTGKGLFHASLADLNGVAEGRLTEIEAVYHGQSDGLADLHFTGRHQPRSWRTSEGQLWFATANGAVFFRAADLATNAPPVRPLIEEVLVNGQRQANITHLRLRSDTRRLEFRFTAPNFTAPERVRFRYQLHGVDDDWVECGAQRSATYANVPFGTHEFRVAACNAAGVWSAAVPVVTLTVRPFFWQAQWFIALCAAMVAGGMAWGLRRATLRRLSQRLERLEQEHALQRERARISQDIHDELGANLTTIALLADMGGRHRANPDALTRDLGQISEMARGTASAMDAIVWAVNPRNDSLDHFANYVGQFTKDFFRPTNIRTRLDLPATLPAQPMSAEVRHNLFLAVKEALNNVVRHAAATEVRLTLQAQHDTLCLTIEDNGRGMPNGPERNGHNGLTNMRARIEKIRGTLNIEPGTEGGTRLSFAVPLFQLNAN